VSPEGVFGKQPPPRLGYPMKGRPAASVLRQVKAWHRLPLERKQRSQRRPTFDIEVTP
jgi:hypothetical protein